MITLIVELLFTLVCTHSIRMLFTCKLAAQNDQYEVAEVLLSNGADINSQQNYYGNTALHIAARFGSCRVLELLLKQGADATLLNNESESIEDMASYSPNDQSIEILQQFRINKTL